MTVIKVQILKQKASWRTLMLWVPTRMSTCSWWLSTVGSWCRERSTEVRCRSTRTGRHTVTGLDQRQATTTTGWDLTRSTVSCSWAASDSGLRWAYGNKTASVIHYEPYVHLYIMNIIFCFCHDKTVQEINSRCATVNICRIRNPKSDNRLLFYGYKYISNMVAVHHLEFKKNHFWACGCR